VIEQTPVPDLSGTRRGVVAGGAVGSRGLGRFRIFHYEIRVWLGGHIPDVAEAVESPRRLASDEERAPPFSRASTAAAASWSRWMSDDMPPPRRRLGTLARGAAGAAPRATASPTQSAA
jgi:hypothetical protein